jgi:hypothetical protein
LAEQAGPPVACRRRSRSAPGSLPWPHVRAVARPWAPEGMRTWRASSVGLRAGPRSEGAIGSSPGGHPCAPRRERIRPSRAGRLRPPGSLRDTSTRSSGGASEGLVGGSPERRPPRPGRLDRLRGRPGPPARGELLAEVRRSQVVAYLAPLAQQTLCRAEGSLGAVPSNASPIWARTGAVPRFGPRW